MSNVARQPVDTFRGAVASLLAGGAPNGITPDQVGEWGEMLSQAYTAHRAGGTPAVVKWWNTQTAGDKRLLRLLAAPTTSTPTPAPSMPALPAAATAVYQHLAPCGQWLDDYIAFAQAAAPMGPRSFHELAGLFAVAVAIARRLVVRVSVGDIYPNIFALWVGDPAIYSKTSALRALVRLIGDAGLNHLLLPEKLTPEALMLQYSLTIPPTLANWQPEARAAWMNERAYAARRGWLLDEASRLFSSLKQDYNQGLLGLLLQLYDCPDSKSEETTGRGRIVVNDTSLSFFGVTTPDAMKEHFSNRALWLNGLWSRFAVITPDRVPDWHFLSAYVPLPPAVLSGYRRIFDLFPEREAELMSQSDGKHETEYVRVYGQDAPTLASLAPGVMEAWEAYAKAVRYDLLTGGAVDRALFGSYGRFATHVVKVAMLLATMDADALPVQVELRHWAKAQQMVEGWRQALHELWEGGIQADEHSQSDKLYSRILAAGPTGMLPRDLYRQLNMRAQDANLQLDELEKAGKIERLPGRGANGRTVQVVRAVAHYTIPEVS